MADVSAIFHWQLHAFDGLSVMELMRWRARAIDRAETLGLLRKE